MKSNNILIIYAHPTGHKSRINTAMIKAIAGLDNVTIRHLYSLYPDFYINVKKEQEQLMKHNIIVFQHPFYWYSCPSLLKEWIDLVFEHGFAFGRKGDALKGKKLITATTTGGRREAYTEGGHNHFTMNQLLAPFKATANLCKLEYLPPFVVHGGLIINETQIIEAAEKYRKLIIALRDGTLDNEQLKDTVCINEIID